MRRPPAGVALRAGLLAAAGFGHVLYPSLVVAAGAFRQPRRRPVLAGRPGLSVVVPAYRERRVIAAKVDDLRRNGYPGPLEVVVVPEDPATEAAAAGTGAVVVPFVERTGKAGALNRGVARCSHDRVVLTDANARLAPGSLEALVAWLDDPAVGAVGGGKVVDGEGAYWRFESALKGREMRLGSSIALDGVVVGLRRSDYRPLPPDVVVDDLWLALDAAERGGAVVYDGSVQCSEGGFATLAADWERRTRIVAGMLDVVWRRRRLLARPSVVAVQLWGHRLIRSSLGPVAHLSLLVLTVRDARRSRPARMFLALHVLGGTLAVRGRASDRATRLERLAYTVLYLQAVGVGGTVRFLRGDRPTRWRKDERSDELGPQPAPAAEQASDRARA
jgi:glycosyltransferase involved in cell wall biosynthesis